MRVFAWFLRLVLFQHQELPVYKNPLVLQMISTSFCFFLWCPFSTTSLSQHKGGKSLGFGLFKEKSPLSTFFFFSSTQFSELPNTTWLFGGHEPPCCVNGLFSSGGKRELAEQRESLIFCPFVEKKKLLDIVKQLYPSIKCQPVEKDKIKKTSRTCQFLRLGKQSSRAKLLRWVSCEIKGVSW